MLKGRKILSLFMALVMIISMFTGFEISSFAEDDILKYLTYEINDGEVTITGCDKTINGSYRLPAEIEGYPVTEIGWQAFMQSSFSYIEFPDTLKKIGYGAFWNSRLELVKIPDSVEIIEGDAFGDCFSLKGIYTGKNITEISSQMLRENGSLTDVFIGKNVKEIDYYAFHLSDNVKNIYFEGTEEEWKKIVVSGSNDVLKTANITFNCSDDSYSIWQPTKYNPDTFLAYSISAGKVTIEGVNWDVYGDLVIPEYIDGCIVTCIANMAFDFLPDLYSVTIPKGVTEIQGTFGGQCFNLQNIIVDEENQYYSSENGNLFNKDKTELLRYAIGNSRQEYTIPDSVTTINECAFVRLYNVLKLNIPESVTEIEDYAFYEAHNLYYITVDENNPNYSSDNGVLFNKDKTVLICFPGLRAGTYYWAGYEDDGIDTVIDSYTIPDGVREIADSAFCSCTELKTVVLPESVENIGESAFEDCKMLEDINLPEGIKSIENFTFRNSGLKSITIPESVTSIGVQSFWSCKNLSEINFSENANIKNIDDEAFYQTEYYNNKDNWENNALYIGNNLIEVSDDSITEYTVKDGTKNIAFAAFSWCSNLKQLNLPDSLCSISNSAFAGLSNVEEIDIPSGVTEIGNYAFIQCNKLSKISIPESVTKIGKGIFYLNNNIRLINYAGDKASWDNIEISDEKNEWVSYLTINYEKEPNADKPTTDEPTTGKPSYEPTTEKPSDEPTTEKPSDEPTTEKPSDEPTTEKPSDEPATEKPSDEPATDKPTEKPVTGKIEIKSDAVKVDESNKILTISDKTTSEALAKVIDNDNFVIVGKDGKELGKSDLVGTGSKIQIKDNSDKVASEYTVLVPNDVDGNGKITAADARLVLRVSAKLEKVEGVYALASDVTGDGYITAADARKILRVSAGLE